MTWHSVVSAASGLASAAMAGSVLVPMLAGLSGWHEARRRIRRHAAIPDRLRASAEFPEGTPPTPARIPVRAAIDDALALLEPMALSLDVRLDLDVEPRLTAYADPRALRRLLIELVRPAMAANPHTHLLLVAGSHGASARIVLAADDVGERAARTLVDTARIRAALGASLQTEILQGAGTTTILTLPTRPPMTEHEPTDLATHWNLTLDRSMAAFRAVLSAPQESATDLHGKGRARLASAIPSPENHTVA